MKSATFFTTVTDFSEQREFTPFLQDDFATAFTFASPNIQGIFGTHQNFGQMVRSGYPMVWRPADVQYIELREFQAEYFDEGPPEVRTRINAKIVKLPERIIIGAQTFEARTRARSTDLEVIIQGFDEALGRVLKQVVVWTLETAGRPSSPARK